MRKLENKRMSLLWCGLLCALLMSGCSGMLQSLADGTDAVLGGLANGADQVTGALADMTDAALDAAADATDDSEKDAILDAYSSLVDTVGSWALTLEGSLQGERVPGEDDYTGTYAADYEDFSGTELLFGGTTLDREAGDTVEVTCSLTVEEGEAGRLPVLRRGGAGAPAVRERGLLRYHRGGQRKRLSRRLGRRSDRERVIQIE